MKKPIYLLALLALTMITSSFKSYNYNQSTDFPPIQKFLDKAVGKTINDFIDDDVVLTQELTNNSCTITKKMNEKYKTVFSNIRWEQMYDVSFQKLKYTKNISYCRFEFGTQLTYTMYNKKDEIEHVGQQNSFKCYILTKDMDEVIKIIELWKKSNKK